MIGNEAEDGGQVLVYELFLVQVKESRFNMKANIP